MHKQVLTIFTILTMGVTPVWAWKLWYRQAPSARNVSNPWMEYGLPIGNGCLGGMVMGGTSTAEVQLNEKTFWTGDTKERGAYQNIGYLRMEDLRNTEKTAEDYRIELDLDEAIVTEEWTDIDGGHFMREYLASSPDNCIAIHLTATRQSVLNLLITLEGTHQEQPNYDEATGNMTTPLELLTGAVVFRVSTTDGSVRATENGIELTNATEALVLVSAQTDYDPLAVSFVRGLDDTLLLSDLCKHVSGITDRWRILKARHTEDYQRLYQRMLLTLEDTEIDVPTDELIARYATDASEEERRYLEQLFFAYGRYLLIASSRGVPLPANLQGIWNNSNSPPWASDIHANINVQMNYWPAETTNLSETAIPLLDWIYNNAIVQPHWRKYAYDYTGTNAGWLCFWENNNTGFSWVAYPNHSYCAVPVWLCWHLWQHFLYTLDDGFLRERALPVMLSCVDFWMERLIIDAIDGTWVCPQEWSPEQGLLDDGTAHTQQCVWNLFNVTLKAIDILGLQSCGLSEERYEAIAKKFSQLDNGIHTEQYTGAYGKDVNGVKKGELILREWKHLPYSNAEQANHRHISHLMCLYPFHLLGNDDSLYTAIRNSLLLRGDENTGWAMAWRMCLWARLGDGERAYGILSNALKHAGSYGVSISPRLSGIYFNMLSAHPPFQIDGNLGTCAAIAEMLFQSHSDTLRLLPALPQAWAQHGMVHGIRAEGGFEIDMEWEDAVIKSLTVQSNAGRECHLKLPLNAYAVISEGSGGTEEYIAECSAEEGALSFPTEKGRSYFLELKTTAVRDIPSASTEHRPSSPRTSFDLSGRRLSTPPAKGIYIKDGRTILVK